MAKMKELYQDIVDLLDDSENTPMLISKKLNVPVEMVLDVMSTLENEYYE
jgi:hypothetical protein